MRCKRMRDYKGSRFPVCLGFIGMYPGGGGGASSSDLWNTEAALWDTAAFTWN